MPLVSVITPTYNRLRLLGPAVASVCAQSVADWELIVVDDGSSDGTVEWMRARGDPRIHCISLPHTGDVGRLRNEGARAARGQFLAFLDSDDLWHPAKLETQLMQMRAADAPWSYTRYRHIDAAGNEIQARAGEWRALSGWIARDMIEDNTAVSIITVLMQRRLFDRLGGFPEGVRTREDVDLLLRAALLAPAVAVPECLASAREHTERTTASLSPALLHEASAGMYARLMPAITESAVARAARQKRAGHLRQACAAHLRGGAPIRAARCYGRWLVEVSRHE